MKKYLGIDVGGTNIKYGIINCYGEILSSGSRDTKIDKNIFLENIKNLILTINQETPLNGVGISFPGFIDSDNGVLITAGVFNAFLAGFHLKEYLEKETRILCEIENDVNSVALAEKWTGNGREYSDFLCMTIGSGVGGAIVLGNEIYKGKGFSAGEFGFMVTKGIENNLASECVLSRSSAMFPLRYRYAQKYGKPYEDVTGEEVFSSDKPYAKWLVENMLENISIALFNLFCILNPEIILIGGAVSKREDIIPRLNEKLSILFENSDIKHKIDTCYHKNNAGVVGAVYNFIKRNNEQEEK